MSEKLSPICWLSISYFPNKWQKYHNKQYDDQHSTKDLKDLLFTVCCFGRWLTHWWSFDGLLVNNRFFLLDICFIDWLDFASNNFPFFFFCFNFVRKRTYNIKVTFQSQDDKEHIYRLNTDWLGYYPVDCKWWMVDHYT